MPQSWLPILFSLKKKMKNFLHQKESSGQHRRSAPRLSFPDLTIDTRGLTPGVPTAYPLKTSSK